MIEIAEFGGQHVPRNEPDMSTTPSFRSARARQANKAWRQVDRDDVGAAARCLDADRFGLTLLATTPAGELTVRIPYEEPIDDAEGLRKATVKLAKRSRGVAIGVGAVAVVTVAVVVLRRRGGRR